MEIRTAKKLIKKLMSILRFKMYRKWNKGQFERFIEKNSFSVDEMKLTHGGLAPVGVMIAHKEGQ